MFAAGFFGTRSRSVVAIAALVLAASQVFAGQEASIIADETPGPLATTSLLLAGVLLLAFSGSVLGLAVRELRKDKQRRRTKYRRPARRRGPAESPTNAV